MAEKEAVIKEKVEEAGIFDFAGLYGFAYSWLVSQEDYGLVEEKYSEKVSAAERDLEIEWKASKKLSDYFKIELGMKYNVSKMSEVEVEIDGVKKKMNKGRVIIELKGTLIRDPESKWDANPLYKFFREVYDKYVVPQRVDASRDKVMSDVITLKDSIKAFLDLSGKRR